MLTSSQITLNTGAHLEFVNNTGGYDAYIPHTQKFLWDLNFSEGAHC